MYSNRDILYQYPVSLGNEKCVGVLVVSSSRLVWSKDSHSVPEYMATWDEISSVQTGKIKYCGLRVALSGSSEYTKFIIGPVNRANLLILEELRRAIKMVRNHFDLKDCSQGEVISSEVPPRTLSFPGSELIQDTNGTRRKHKSCGDADNTTKGRDNIQTPPSRPRERSLRERVHGNMISAKISVFGGGRKGRGLVQHSPQPSDWPLQPSPELSEYMSRSRGSGISSRHTPSSSNSFESSHGAGKTGPWDNSPTSSPEGVSDETHTRKQKAIYEEEEEELPTPPVQARGSGELRGAECVDQSGQADAGAANTLTAVEQAQIQIAEKKLKKMDLMKRCKSARGAGVNGTGGAPAEVSEGSASPSVQPAEPRTGHCKHDKRQSEIKWVETGASDVTNGIIADKDGKKLPSKPSPSSAVDGVYSPSGSSVAFAGGDIINPTDSAGARVVSFGNTKTSDIVDVKALVAQQQNRRAALARRRSGLV